MRIVIFLIALLSLAMAAMAQSQTTTDRIPAPTNVARAFNGWRPIAKLWTGASGYVCLLYYFLQRVFR
jgi:hypothetical protein